MSLSLVGYSTHASRYFMPTLAALNVGTMAATSIIEFRVADEQTPSRVKIERVILQALSILFVSLGYKMGFLPSPLLDIFTLAFLIKFKIIYTTFLQIKNLTPSSPSFSFHFPRFEVIYNIFKYTVFAAIALFSAKHSYVLNTELILPTSLGIWLLCQPWVSRKIKHLHSLPITAYQIANKFSVHLSLSYLTSAIFLGYGLGSLTQKIHQFSITELSSSFPIFQKWLSAIILYSLLLDIGFRIFKYAYQLDRYLPELIRRYSLTVHNSPTASYTFLRDAYYRALKEIQDTEALLPHWKSFFDVKNLDKISRELQTLKKAIDEKDLDTVQKITSQLNSSNLNLLTQILNDHPKDLPEKQSIEKIIAEICALDGQIHEKFEDDLCSAVESLGYFGFRIDDGNVVLRTLGLQEGGLQKLSDLLAEHGITTKNDLVKYGILDRKEQLTTDILKAKLCDFIQSKRPSQTLAMRTIHFILSKGHLLFLAGAGLYYEPISTIGGFLPILYENYRSSTDIVQRIFPNRISLYSILRNPPPTSFGRTCEILLATSLIPTYYSYRYIGPVLASCTGVFVASRIVN